MALFSKFFTGKSEHKHFILDRVVDGFLPFALVKLVEEVAENKSLVVFVARDGQKLEDLARTIAFIRPDLPTIQFPGWDCLPYDRVSPGVAVCAQRLSALAQLCQLRDQGKPALVLTSANAILQKLPPREILAKQSMHIQAGKACSRNDLIHYLEHNGFEQVANVCDFGEYAVRGGIVDLFSSERNVPLRLDFFGNECESIHEFDPETQLRGDALSECYLYPMNEISLDKDAISRFRSSYIQLFGAVKHTDALYEAISEGRRFASMEHWLPLFYDQLETLLDYTGPVPVILDHLASEALEERSRLIVEYYQARLEQTTTKTRGKTTTNLKEEYAPYHPLPPELLYLNRDALFKQLQTNSIRIDITAFAYPHTDILPSVSAGSAESRHFTVERNDSEIHLFSAVVDHIRALRSAGKKVFLAGWSEGSLQRLIQLLQEHGLEGIDQVKNFKTVKVTPRNRICAAVLAIEHGFETKDLSVVAEQDIFGDRLVRRHLRRKSQTNGIVTANSLQVGDIVVHIDHGIGRFKGLTVVQAAGSLHDCLEICYAGEDRLFLPVENIELLSRYSGETSEVVLDRLGSAAWQMRKTKLRANLLEIAGKLIAVAAQRRTYPAARMVVEPGIYDEFTARFPYEETEDQLRTIDNVLQDLSAGFPMDRLVCGDVGFGKTEIAIRAAFVAAMSGFQVAVVVPTTLLARQHYKTFMMRFQGLPLTVGHASRLVSADTIAHVKKTLKDGTLDIVIGTHALLGNGVEFARLGLLIIDEEQHFGVKHKEKLKELKTDIHVLTLSATPIPRTLQLALTGVRELSLITTPPVDRMAVRTFVSPFDGLVIRETLLREHYRGGQSFYVCPRISDLVEIRDFLAENTPELKIAVAHGQMPAGQLDDIMNAFYDGQYDVLLSTSIVESGLDVPTANSLIVHRADMFGLAALYQLRGRVGRSKQRAYALFTLPTGRLLTPGAERRLKVLQALDTLGAGFQLASHDMDIRGAGNLLGDAQSGHIKEVGFELYQQMLEEAIAEIKDNEPIEDIGWSPQISLGISIMIPESYVSDLQLRLDLYKRVSHLEDGEAVEAFAAELIDRFGPLPSAAQQFLKVVSLKMLCRKLNIEKLDVGPKGAVIAFRNGCFANAIGLMDFIGAQGSQAKINPNQNIVFIRDWPTKEARLKGAFALLGELVALLREK